MDRTYAGIPEEYAGYENAKVVVLPVPYDETSTWVKGADQGPEAFLEASENMEIYDLESDTEVYKRANVDRKLFSKIRINRFYQPKKNTAVAFALALRLNVDETKDFLKRAGYAFSPSSKFDLIVEYFIDQKVYDIYTINLALFEHGQPLLGE